MVHVDAGKTTTTERILALADGFSRVDAAADDGAPLGVTLASAATRCSWLGCSLDIVDTPGQLDLVTEVERALRVLDGAVALVCGVNGVERETETFWRQADTYRVPRLAFVNKLDKPGADFCRVVDEMKLRLNATVLPVQLPIVDDGRFVGLVDLVEQRAWRFSRSGSTAIAIPNRLAPLVDEYREALLDALVEFDDDIADRYLANDEIDTASLRAAIRNATIHFDVVPVFAGAAFRSYGLGQLLDGIVAYLPAPADLLAVEGRHPSHEGEILVREADLAEPFAGLSFKIVHDEQLGLVNYVRVFSGRVTTGDAVLNTTSEAPETVRALHIVDARRYVEVASAEAGDIVAVSGLEHTTIGDTLSDASHPIVLESLDYPQPVFALLASTERDSESHESGDLACALKRLSRMDPSFRYRLSADGSAVSLEGLSESHLAVLVARLEREHGLELTVGDPRIAYRATVPCCLTGLGSVDGVVARIDIAPNERGGGLRFESRLSTSELEGLGVADDAIDRALRAAVESGQGGIAASPFVDVTTTLLSVSGQKMSESQLASATRAAVENAIAGQDLALLEPVMRLEVLCPEGALGDVLGDVTVMRGHVKRIESRGALRVVSAEAPLAELIRRGDKIGLDGEATTTMHFAHYERLSFELADAHAAAN